MSDTSYFNDYMPAAPPVDTTTGLTEMFQAFDHVGLMEGTEITFRDFPRNELETAFDLVTDSKDWRAAINFTGRMTIADLNKVDAAIIFFTGTEITIELKEVDENGCHLFGITAIGYRNGPCGP